MLGYAARRLVSSLVVLAVTSFLAFAFFYTGPVNPAYEPCISHGRCTPEKLAAIEASMGYDESLLTNYGRFVGGLVHDRTIEQGATYHCDAPCLGVSFRTDVEVTKDLVRYYPATLSLALGAGLLYLLLGLPVGALAARFRGSWADKGLVGGSLVLSSLPFYVVALAAWVATLRFGVLQTGYVPITQDVVGWFLGLLVPWLVLGITGAPTYVRYVRGLVVETLEEDYIRAGLAKGLSQRRLLYQHSLRVAVVPVLTIFGLDLAGLLSGLIFTEAIFGIDGIGSWTLRSVRGALDLPVVNATILVFAVAVVVGNLLVDLLFAALDPRVRLA